MTDQNDRPADTRLMGVVHDALRRDLKRSTTALTTTEPPAAAQGVAIAAHLQWMMHFLHAHHAGEDQGLWPLVRTRNPSAGDMLDEMDADHARIRPHIGHVADTAAAYGTESSPAARQNLAAAIESLHSELDPHLRREEDQMMPVVSASLTHTEWEAFNTTTYVKPKSKRQLGQEGHWLIDSLDPERYQVVVRTVAALPRFILIHAMAGAYRRECAARWGPHVQIGPLPHKSA